MKKWKSSPAFERALRAARSQARGQEFDRHLDREWERRSHEMVLNEIAPRCETLAGAIPVYWDILEPSTPLLWGWHLNVISEHLEAVSANQIKRLLVNVPPGTMKSLLVSVMWPAWEWGPGGLPNYRYLTTSYEGGLVRRDNDRMRTLVQDPIFQSLWGDKCRLRDGLKSQSVFENISYGRREGRAFKSLTGGRGDRVILDDPHSVSSAESPRQRTEALRIFQESVPSRVNNNDSAIVIICQRLHERDISALAIEQGYEHLLLPMRFESERSCKTVLGKADRRMAEGEILAPNLFPAERIERDERSMTSYAIAGQWQQRPVAREGGVFQREWFEVVGSVPVGRSSVRAWDFASRQPDLMNNDPDWTVGLKGMRTKDGVFIVTDMIRVRKSSGEVAKIVKAAAQQDGGSCKVRIPQDPGQAGVQQVEFYTRLLAGLMIKAKPVSGDKFLRSQPAAAQAEHGQIKLLRGGWVDTFLDEVCGFQAGAAHDDIVDALADLIAELSEMSAFTLDNVG